MLLTTHVSTSILICQGLNNPWLAFFIGLVMHYLLDMIPHGDHIKNKREYLLSDFSAYKDNKGELRQFRIIPPIDVVLASLLIIYLYISGQFGNPDIVIPGIIGGILPDIIMLINIITNRIWLVRKINWFHLKIHTIIKDIPLAWAISGQAVYNVLVLYILFFIHGAVV